MSKTCNTQEERIRQAADRLYAEAQRLDEFTRARIIALAGPDVGLSAFYRVFPGSQFVALKRAWLISRIEHAAQEVFAAAHAQRYVTIQQIADRVGCSLQTVTRLAGQELRDRLKTLGSSQEHMLQAIERLVEARVPLSEYTWKRVYAEAGERLRLTSQEVDQAFRDGRETLIRYHDQQRQQRVPGATYACIQGDWINVDEPTWYLAATQRALRRDRLRPDIAALAWPMLREEALTMEVSAQTLDMHYQYFLLVAKLFGETIPDIGIMTLEAIQQAWFRFEASVSRRRQVRALLERMFERLLMQETLDAHESRQEYARVLHWLQTIRLKQPASEKAYLSESEFDVVLDACLEDIMQGLVYMRQAGSVVGQTTTAIHAEQAEPVLHWGIALSILVMAFTGLRRQSVVRLTTEDIAQIGPQAFALAWRHGKPNKQRIAIIPALVAEHLQHYIQVTAPVRARMVSPRIFFTRNRMGRWDQMTDRRMDVALETFVRRHALQRSDEPLRLGSTLLRRTYVTRALYVLPSIAALQAQLGHENARTTLSYAQSDRFEHPALVDNALDAFGKKVLTRWHTPLLLEHLPDAERQALLETSVAHSQDIGLCRHDCCVKLEEERLPPCSLCEHLVSGPEYLAAWEREKVLREQQLERLTQTSGTELLFAQMKGQYDRFLMNFQFLQERSHR
jgi:integrase